MKINEKSNVIILGFLSVLAFFTNIGLRPATLMEARNFITNDDIKDTGCPLKLFKKKVVESFYLFEGMHRFLPTLAKINGFKVVEVPVRHYDREFGVSKYGVFNRLFKGLKDAFAVRWMKTRKLKYVIEKGEENND